MVSMNRMIAYYWSARICWNIDSDRLVTAFDEHDHVNVSKQFEIDACIF